MVEAENAQVQGGPAPARLVAQRREAADVLGWLFVARPDDRRLARLAHAALMQNPPLRDALLMPRNVVPAVAQASGRATRKGEAVQEVPLWLLQADWPEFLDAPGRAALAGFPDLPTRLALAAPELGPQLETALEGGRAFRRPRRPEAVQLGLYATALAVHGRYNRALKILHWLDGARPGQADVAKRLANVCWAAGSHDAALRWLHAATGAAPGNALLHLALAQRLIEAGQGAAAHRQLDAAEALWPELDLAALGAGPAEDDGAATGDGEAG